MQYTLFISLRLRGGMWAYKTSLSLPLFIEMPVPSQESELSCMCVGCLQIHRGINFASVSIILQWDLFWQCGIILFFILLSLTWISYCLCKYHKKFYKWQHTNLQCSFQRHEMLILVLGMCLLIVLYKSFILIKILCITWLNKEVYISSYKAFFILF